MSERFERLVSTYWPLIVAVILVASAWGYNTRQINNVGDSLTILSTKIDKGNDKIDDVATDVTKIKAALPYVDRDIARLRDRVQQLEARR